MDVRDSYDSAAGAYAGGLSEVGDRVSIGAGITVDYVGPTLGKS
jgi:hypothetical protein